MRITWLGTASIIIETDQSKILFDPYLRKFRDERPDFPFEKIVDADAIFITHPHFDHFADIPDILPKVSCDVYTNARGLEIARKRRYDLSRIKRIGFGDGLTFGDITVKALRGRHVRFDRPLVFSTLKRAFNGHFRQGLKVQSVNKHYKIDLDNDVFAYFVTAGNTSVLIFGSASCNPQEHYPAPDILVYPYQGRSDILSYSMEIVGKIAPKSVICDHFDDAFPPITANIDISDFKTALEKRGIGVVIPTENTPIII